MDFAVLDLIRRQRRLVGRTRRISHAHAVPVRFIAVLVEQLHVLDLDIVRNIGRYHYRLIRLGVCHGSVDDSRLFAVERHALHYIRAGRFMEIGIYGREIVVVFLSLDDVGVLVLQVLARKQRAVELCEARVIAYGAVEVVARESLRLVLRPCQLICACYALA